VSRFLGWPIGVAGVCIWCLWKAPPDHSGGIAPGRARCVQSLSRPTGAAGRSSPLVGPPGPIDVPSKPVGALKAVRGSGQ